MIRGGGDISAFAFSNICVYMSVISVVCARDFLNPVFSLISCGIYQFNNCCKGVVW